MLLKTTALLALSGVALTSCGGNNDPAISACTPGAVQGCPCAGGGSGMQTCMQEGTWTQCGGCQGGGADGFVVADAGLPADSAASGDSEVSFKYSTTVQASANMIDWKSCGPSPAEIGPLQPGDYQIMLNGSTLSKGANAKDNYVVAQLPVGNSSDKVKFRYISLNGINDTFDFTVAQSGKVRLWFIDSDAEGNAGDAIVAVSPGGHSATVSAVSNVIEWDKKCGATPAEMDGVAVGSYTIRLVGSTLSAGGSKQDLVLVRLPLEIGNPASQYRYVVLNGVGASHSFTFAEDSWGTEPVRAWFISEAGAGAAGQATVALE